MVDDVLLSLYGPLPKRSPALTSTPVVVLFDAGELSVSVAPENVWFSQVSAVADCSNSPVDGACVDAYFVTLLTSNCAGEQTAVTALTV